MVAKHSSNVQVEARRYLAYIVHVYRLTSLVVNEILSIGVNIGPNALRRLDFEDVTLLPLLLVLRLWSLLGNVHLAYL